MDGRASRFSFELSDAVRRVLLGLTPTRVQVTARSRTRLDSLREQFAHRVADDASVIASDDGRMRWWTFAGARANSVLTAAVGAVAPELLDQGTFTNLHVSLRSDATAASVASALRMAREGYGEDLAGVIPPVTDQALRKLKFAEMLPPALATATLSARNADFCGTAAVLARAVVEAPSDRKPSHR